MSFSVFVDAGYLFKQGSLAVLKTKASRRELVLDARGFTEGLTSWVCRRYPGDELLRTYWYDGARQGVPRSEQAHIAALPFVKLRLGRINTVGRQKGVDTLIVRDLMVLSQERSILRAVVLSGDEDLREGIEYAQDRGVRVAVVGIDADGRRNQSLELVQEADENLVLPPEILERTLTSAPAAAGDGSERPESEPLSGSSSDSFVECARQFADEWLKAASPAEIESVGHYRPRLPRAVDALMLDHAAVVTGVQSVPGKAKREMRAAFWATIDSETATSP